MKKAISRKVIIPLIITISILLIVLLANMFTNNELIKQIMPEMYRQEETEILVDGIACKVLDNTGEKIKAFVTITRENGIENIEYMANNGETVKLNCNNRKKVTIDTEMLVNEEQQYKVTSNGEEKVEIVSLSENYIDDYIKYIKLDNDEPYDQIDIQFTPVQDSLNYFKINNDAWKTYSSTLSLDISNVVLEKLQNNEYDINIYTMSVDSSGNTLVANKTIELTKKCPNFNLFYNMDISAKTNLGEYGLWVKSWGNTRSDWRRFQVRAMGGGSYNGQGSYSATIVLNWNNPNLTFDNITTTFNLWTNYPWGGTRTGARGNIKINYTDGTSNSSATGGYSGYGTGYKNAVAYPNKNKQIQSIEFICSGWWEYPSGSTSRVQEIYFNGLQKVNN